MKIQNALGQVLYEFEINSDNGTINSFIWDSEKFPLAKGVYQISLMVNGVLTTRSLIHQ